MSSPALLQQLCAARLPSAIWQRNPTVFGAAEAAAEVKTAILNRLGWLDAPTAMEHELPQLRDFVVGLQRDELTDVYLLGMGGSSLCAEVLRDIVGTTSVSGRLTVLDTTDERTVRQVTEALVPERAFFI